MRLNRNIEIYSLLMMVAAYKQRTHKKDITVKQIACMIKERPYSLKVSNSVNTQTLTSSSGALLRFISANVKKN